jgi:hypothetical protein
MPKAIQYVLYFLGYMAVWTLILLPVALYLNKYQPDNDALGFMVVGTFFLLIVGGMIPYMQWLGKKIFHYPGKGNPVGLEELRCQITAINEWDVPVMVRETGKKLIVTWNYVNAKWYGIISKSGMNNVYELVIKFDEQSKTALLTDIHKKARWGVEVGSARISMSFFRGIDMAYERGIAYGIRESFELGKIYDYTFRSAEIKDPVMNTIRECGWDVRFSML